MKNCLFLFLVSTVSCDFPVDLAVDGFQEALKSKYIIQNGSIFDLNWEDPNKTYTSDVYNPYINLYLSVTTGDYSKEKYRYTLTTTSRNSTVGTTEVIIGNNGYFSRESRKHIQINFICALTGEYVTDFYLEVTAVEKGTAAYKFVINRACEAAHPLPGFMVGALITGDDDGMDPNVVCNGITSKYFDGDFEDPRYQLISPEGDTDDTFTVWSTGVAYPFSVYEVLFDKDLVNVTYVLTGDSIAEQGAYSYIDVSYVCQQRADMTPISITLKSALDPSEGITFTYLKNCDDDDAWFDPYLLLSSLIVLLVCGAVGMFVCWCKRQRDAGRDSTVEKLCVLCFCCSSCLKRTENRILPGGQRISQPDELGQELVEREGIDTGSNTKKMNAKQGNTYGAL